MKAKESILIIGASTRAAAFSALRASFVPCCHDMFADIDLQEQADARCVADYPAGLLHAGRSRPPSAWLYTGALENHPRMVDRLAAVSPLLGNTGPVLRRVRHPRELSSALRRAGLECPRFSSEPNGIPIDGSWLVKPRRSAGGKDVAAWMGQPLAGHGQRDWYLQERIEGQAIAAVYLADGHRGQFLGATEQLIGRAWGAPGEFSYAGSVGPLPLTSAEQTACERIGAALAADFGLRGLFGVDAVRNAAGIWPVEVNPRYPASAEVLERVSGISLIGAHVAACRGAFSAEIPVRELPAAHRFAGKLIHYALEDREATTPFVARLMSQRGGDRLMPLVADIPRPGTRLRAGWPICTLLADGANREGVLNELTRRGNDL